MSSKYDAIIIGGGLGGLTAAATLVKQGKKVLLLEQHYIPGGCATTFKRKDYIFEVGLHEIDGLNDKDSKLEIFRFLGVDKHIKFLTAPEFYRYKSKDTDFIFPHGRHAAIDALIEKFPDEAKGIRKFVDFMDGVGEDLAKFPQNRWKQIALLPLMPLLYPSLVKSSRMNLGDWLDKYISNDELKLILTGNLQYYHDDPYTMSMLYFSAAQSSYINGGGHFIQGGSQELSNYLATMIDENGGQVLLAKKATQILVEDGKACGVVFEDSFSSGSGKTEVYADRIIANAAVPLVVDMLPEKEATKLAGRIDNLENACALISVYIGFNKAPKELGSHHYSTILAGDDVKTLADLRANNHGPWENRNLIFVDYSQVDSRLAPEGKGVGVICAVDYLADWNTLDEYSYATKKEEVACILLSRLEKLLPGIGEQIEHYDIGTSRTIQHYTLNPDGTPYGFAQTPAQSGMGRVPSKSPTENLYFAGAWTFPGAGFTGAIISGFLCGEAVTGTLPNTTKGSPERLPDERIVQLVEKREIATATIELAFEKPPGFVYKAGQYAVLELMNPRYQELDMPIRPLSMASHPDEEVVRFTMRLSDSSFKKSVHALELGGKCRLFGPMGSFSVAGNGRGIVFLISGIGITPVLPFLKELEKSGISQPVYLFYSNRTEAAAAYHRELKAVAMPTFKYIPVFTGTQARIDGPFLEDELGSFAEFDYYLVGTHGFLDSMQSLLRANNVNEAQIYADDYG